MKFDCGPTYAERREADIAARERWHSWFSWHPVRVGPRDCRWLELVERKGRFRTMFCGMGTDQWWEWKYRAIDQ